VINAFLLHGEFSTKTQKDYNIMFFIYNFIIHLCFPLIIGFLLWPQKGKPTYGARWKEHLGWVPLLQNEAPIWIHAVSVGETLAVTPFIRAFKKQYPHVPILLTTTTRTGADQADKLGALVEHRYAPLDYPAAVHHFLQTIRPRALIMMETELWPNLLRQCARRKVPVFVLNARLSERSCIRYTRFQGLFHSMTKNIDRVLCQTQDDATRFQRLGLTPGQLVVTGSIKYDMQANTEQIVFGEQNKQQQGNRLIWVAASTHRGEDEQILAAHQLLLTTQPDALLIVIPRHPEHFHEVAELCEKSGFSVTLRSSQQPATATTQVLLGDSMGEMWLYLAMADLVFMGGSFVSVGGHNVLEPAALHKPVLIGPHYFNFTDITQQLVQEGGCQIVSNPQDLAMQLQTLAGDAPRRQQMGDAAYRVVQRNQGAIARSIDALRDMLPND
jgi:3-deoxy-D-manno-octulosonic-acid transferase